MLKFDRFGIFCEPAGIYIDPWKPVDKAIITHAHSDHAKFGNKHYLAHHQSIPVLKYRLGQNIQAQGVAYGETIVINGVTISLHPAGHIIGSAQVRLEYKGEVWVVSGDYKLQQDDISTPYESLKCHHFVTESTFGLPIYNFPAATTVAKDINKWWQVNKQNGKNSIIIGYALGKAQRIIKQLNPSIGNIFTHGAVANLNDVLSVFDLDLPETRRASTIEKKELQGNIIVAPPSAIGTPWLKRFEPYSLGICSGWMQLRGARRRRGADRGFILSDHADSPKGIARFMQRAGRSGHQPGATSKIYFVPTHSLEIIEGSAMRYAVKNNKVESRIPYIRSFDVLIQYLMTLAVSDGFIPEQVFEEIKQTHCFNSITWDEFSWCLSFITTGGKSLYAYDEFHKVVIENGVYKVLDRRIAMQHRLSMGTIVSGGMLQIKFVTGKYLGTIEEWFISRLKPGDVFWFAGRNLEFVRIKDMTVQVRSSTSKNGIIPSWQGGKMPLSTQLAATIRHQLNEYEKGNIKDKELKFLSPLLEEQRKRSVLPNEHQLLIEKIVTKEGCHVFVYPFEGRYVHEGMAAIMANRIALFKPITFSIAMNDYGFELLSDQDIPIKEAVDSDLFTTAHLSDDILKSVNTTEMAKRRFRDIAGISGLVFTGFPGKQIKTKHLQASSKLFFSVFEDYEKDNLLLKEAYDELYDFQLEVVRLRNAFERIEKQEIIVKKLERFSPFSFPIFTERWREKFSNEDISTRVQRIKAQMEKA